MVFGVGWSRVQTNSDSYNMAEVTSSSTFTPVAPVQAAFEAWVAGNTPSVVVPLKVRASAV